MSSRSDDFNDDDYQPAGGSIWQTIQRLLKALIVVAVVAFVICAFLPELQKQRIAQQEEEKLRLLIQQRTATKLRKQRELNWLKNDPGYVEIIARDKLDLKKEGEVIYRIEMQKPAATDGNAASPAPRATPSPAPRG